MERESLSSGTAYHTKIGLSPVNGIPWSQSELKGVDETLKL